MKKKGFTLIELLATIIVLALIGLIVYPTLNNVISGNRDKLYNKQMEELVRHANTWAVANVDKIGDSDAYLLTFDEMHKSGLLSNSTVKNPKTNDDLPGCMRLIKNDSNGYDIEYSDDCTLPPTIVSSLLEQYNESNTTGLLKDDSGYYYKGTNAQVANNFVWFAGHLWRVISIDNDNNLTMITQQQITAIHPTKTVWTTEQQYKDSYINQWLNDVFLASITDSDKTKLLDNTYNIGIYTNVSEITTTSKAGLLDVIQYTKAGGENSYLDIKDYFWLGNRYSTSSIYFVDVNGRFNSNYPSATYGLRAVVKISNLTITKGNGTLENPYRSDATTTNTSNIKVGEYVSVPTTGDECGTDKKCLFRVVSKDGDSIKVVLNGLLSNTSAFGTSATYTSGNTIDTKLKTFASTIDSRYRYTGNKTFGIGTYEYVANYATVQGTTYQGNVGLPVVGEMFSGNDIDISTSTTKTFVNVSTIESSSVSNCYWTMNAYSTSNVFYVDNYGLLNDGHIGNYGSSSTFGVRPVLFLKNNLTFTAGDGTAENPFTLE